MLYGPHVFLYDCIRLCINYKTVLLTSAGWMHHAVEQFGGRGTRDSFPLDGLNRGPWPPVGGRAWQPPARFVAMTTCTLKKLHKPLC